MRLPWWLGGKKSACNVQDLVLIPGLSGFPGGGHGNPLQYFCLENPHGQRTLVDYSSWVRKEFDTTKPPSTAQHTHIWTCQVALVVKNLPTNAGDIRNGFYPGVGKISWRRAWQPTPVFLPGESPRTEKPGGLQAHGVTKSRTGLSQ